MCLIHEIHKKLKALVSVVTVVTARVASAKTKKNVSPVLSPLNGNKPHITLNTGPSAEKRQNFSSVPVAGGRPCYCGQLGLR